MEQAIQSKEFSDDISFFKNRSSFGSNKSIPFEQFKRMNTKEKKYLETYILKRCEQTDVRVKQQVD
jgi:hypothetical protein